MNIKDFQELIDLTDYLAVSNEYLIRKFTEGGNYLIIEREKRNKLKPFWEVKPTK